MRMKNFIFKSSNNSDLQKFSLRLALIQTEMRHQRDDLSDIKRRLTRVIGLLTDSAVVDHSLEEYPEEELENATKDSSGGS